MKEAGMRGTPLLLIAAVALALAGCGNSPGSRAVTGGLLGAGAGAAIGSTQGSAGTGALIGGGLGALGGAATAR
jgi:osmotically inducible lipoprotein OsmB